MFETDNNSGFVKPVLQYFLQLLVACPVIVLVSVPFNMLLSLLGLSGEYPSQTYFAGYAGIVCLFTGVAIGWIFGKKAPSFVPIGRWIWVLPAVGVFPDMARQGLTSQAVPWLPDYFFATGSNEGLGVLLVMLPTFSAVGYSIGMAFVGRKWASLSSLSPMPRMFSVMAACFALFSLLVLLMHNFGSSRIEMWSRVRTVIDRPGLSLSPDANQLCSTRSPTGLFLPTGTMVEGLERRTCPNGGLLDRDAPVPSGSWSIERVRVLNGSNGGTQGWVLAYGIQETLQR